MKKLPGIFNDVIGPVMRGPSSSHTAATWRIARTSLDILKEPLHKAIIEFEREGAWASNYREQGTTMGVEGGLLGLGITDERIKNTEDYADEKGISIEYRLSSFPVNHTNTVRLTLVGINQKKVQLIAVSLGGGSFEIQNINGFPVNINGELYELIIISNENRDISEEINAIIPPEVEFLSGLKEDGILYECKSPQPFSPEFLHKLQTIEEIGDILVINPIMPVISGRQKEMPFTTIQSLIEYAEKTNSSLGELGLLYEKCISGMEESELFGKMDSIVQIIHKGIDIGLKGTEYDDRILHQQSHLIGIAEKENRIKNSIINQIIANVSALMESKSGMEVIVAVPTAGSCGTVGGVLRAVSEDIATSKDKLNEAYFAAGIIGAYFAMGPGFSAEEHGCQVECGAASGMAAGAIAHLMEGTARQALDAASMALQNMIGLVCDPVADRVEVPCLGKNVSAAVNAYSSAVMALSGFDAVIPLDQVIETISMVSKTMPSCVKCTGEGGLAITDASKRIKKSLKEN